MTPPNTPSTQELQDRIVELESALSEALFLIEGLMGSDYDESDSVRFLESALHSEPFEEGEF